MEKELYFRNLPHIQPQEGVFFVTFRLAGSLPLKVIKQLKLERNRINLGLPTLSQSLIDQSEYDPDLQMKDKLFLKYDKLLNDANTGPVWLKDEKVATIVKDAIHEQDKNDYKLICFSIMPNHVHLINYKCQRPLYKILQSLKGFTALEANKILNRKGSFWHKESYDNLIRNGRELGKKINYVLQNPVKAGIVKDWREHPFTFCHEKYLRYLE